MSAPHVLTKYEVTQIVALRAALIDAGAAPALTREELADESDALAIAMREFALQRIDAIVLRDTRDQPLEVRVRDCAHP